MLLKNNTRIDDALLITILKEAVDAYADLYTPSSSESSESCEFPESSGNPEVEFQVFDSKDEMKKVRIELTDDSSDNEDYDGNFVSPKQKSNLLTILALVKDEALAGAEQYFMEKKNGSLRDADISFEERAVRGEKLMAFFGFVEMIQHEYSHLCNYEQLMKATDWADPGIAGHDWNYHLHDEFIARYRGTRAMLHMIEAYAEPNLLYSLWMGYWDDLKSCHESHLEKVKKLLEDSAKGIEAETLSYMRQNRLSGSDMAAELEQELGHPLHFQGELKDSGVPKMSALEIAEFLNVDEMKKKAIPLSYVIRNPYASYHGAQLFGLIQAFHDHFSEGNPDGLELSDSDLNLTEAMKTPYYEYVDGRKVKKVLEQFIERFTDIYAEA